MLRPAPPKPPKHLGRDGRRFFRDVQRQYQIDDAAGVQLLTTACEALDRSREAQRILDEAGLMASDRYGQPRAHPMVDVERRAQQTLMTALRQLGLDLEPLRDTSPKEK